MHTYDGMSFCGSDIEDTGDAKKDEDSRSLPGWYGFLKGKQFAFFEKG